MVSDADEYTDKGKGHKDVNIRSNIMLNMLYEAIKSLAENIWGALEAVSTAMVFIYLPRQYTDTALEKPMKCLIFLGFSRVREKVVVGFRPHLDHLK